jgi:hypothetical protein
MRLASTFDRIDIGKTNQEPQIQAKRTKKGQPKGSSCVLKVKAANTRTVMLDHLMYAPRNEFNALETSPNLEECQLTAVSCSRCVV